MFCMPVEHGLLSFLFRCDWSGEESGTDSGEAPLVSFSSRLSLLAPPQAPGTAERRLSEARELFVIVSMVLQ